MIATCSSCGTTGECEVYATLIMCKACIKMEQEHQTPDKQQERLEQSELQRLDNIALETQKAIDNSITVRTDIFNANTMSIVDMKKAIDSDDSIPDDKKHYELANRLLTRFKHLQEVLLPDAKKVLDTLGTEQKSIQVYLNTLSSKLHAEEREKLKLSDINYKPKAPKIVKKRAPKRRKFDKEEVKKYANILGVSESTIELICVSKNATPEGAAEILKLMLEK